MEKQPFFAVEHQRGDARFIVLRQLDYCVRIWTRWLKDNPRQCAELGAKLRELYVPAESRGEAAEDLADA